jgi:hypothetical protein
MKTYRARNNPTLTSVVIPFGKENSPTDELFDDCPVCQLLKQQIANGEVEEITIPINLDEEESSVV